MSEIVEGARDIAGRRVFYQAGLTDLWGDAFIAATVARIKGAPRVCLVAEERPDFAIMMNGRKLLYEVTRADQPGREIGREKKELDEAPSDAARRMHDPDEVVEARVGNVPSMLETAARNKATGAYDPTWGSVIYLNLSEYGWFTSQVESCMVAATEPAHEHFREVLVLWKDRLYQVGGTESP